MRVVKASQKVEHRFIRLDRVVAETAGVYGAQIQVLQRVSHKVRGYEAE